MAADAVDLHPITPSDLDRVAHFLHQHLNSRLSPTTWRDAITPPWTTTGPNHGFMLTHGADVVGANLAFYSERTVRGSQRKICNLAALCVQEEFRAHAVRLLRALVKQRGYDFTDLSPSGNVVALNERLGFRLVDTATALAVNVTAARSAPGRLVTDEATIEATLVEPELSIFRDHRGAGAVRHLVLRQDDRYCYVMARRDRRKHLPLFASIVYVSDPDLFLATAPRIYRRLLRQGALATLIETRLTRRQPPGAFRLRSGRPKMFKSDTLTADDIDNLYSELVCVPW